MCVCVCSFVSLLLCVCCGKWSVNMEVQENVDFKLGDKFSSWEELQLAVIIVRRTTLIYTYAIRGR